MRRGARAADQPFGFESQIVAERRSGGAQGREQAQLPEFVGVGLEPFQFRRQMSCALA